METDFGDEAFAEEISFVFGKMHVVFVTEGAIHDGERMEREVGQLHGDRVNPTDGAAGLETEAGLVGKAHREVICVAGISKALHVIDRTAQVVCAEHPAVLDFRNKAIIASMHTEIHITMSKHMFEVLKITSVQAVLRIVETSAMCSFDKIDGIGSRHFSVLFEKPREGVIRIVVDIFERCPYLFCFAAFDAA